eukprot:scaffold230719_cov42-Prasinocladus_malaysianus.AAC.1
MEGVMVPCVSGVVGATSTEEPTYDQCICHTCGAHGHIRSQCFACDDYDLAPEWRCTHFLPDIKAM